MPKFTPSALIILPLLTACSDTPDIGANPDADWASLPDLDAQILDAMDAGRVPGLSACIVVDGAVAWCGGYGYADLDAGIPVTADTPFMLASVSKAVTGVAAMHLYEAGAFGLDDDIDDHVGFDVKHPEEPTAITPRMLLSHTSGIEDNWDIIDEVVVDGDSPIALGDFLEGYLTPGGQWYDWNWNYTLDGVAAETEYSNIGAALAGYLVEAASGTPFDTYCEREIFAPLGMHEASWKLAGMDESAVAVPYEWRLGSWSGLAHYGYPDYPDGGLRAGAHSMARFLAMFAGGGELDGVRILQSSTVDTMTRAHYPDLDPEQGLIWYDWTLDGQTITGHNGGDYGASAEIGYREDGVGFVVLMNGEGKNRTLADVERALFDAAGSL